MFRRLIVPAVALLGLNAAWGGEIVFVDPAREKASNLPPPADTRARTQQSLERTMDSARHHAGRSAPSETVVIIGDPRGERFSPSTRQAMEARDYRDDDELASPAQVQRAGVPPTDAAKARQAARAWTSSNNDPPERCRTENTVGGIEGTPHGKTVVIQSSKGGVTVCK